MRYAGVIENDFTGKGVGYTVFLQGCPHHCQGCHNPETWNFDGGIEITKEEMTEKVRAGLTKNNITRNLYIQGGEPMCPQNLEYTNMLCDIAKSLNRKIFIWTGYFIEDLIFGKDNSLLVEEILDKADYIIDGPFIEKHKDKTLQMRGSSNQRIFIRKEDGFYETTAEYLTNK